MKNIITFVGLFVSLSTSLAQANSYTKNDSRIDICDESRRESAELLDVVSNYPKGYLGALSIMVDRETRQFCQADYTDNTGTEKHFQIDELRTGAVLLDYKGMKVLVLHAPEFDIKEGGPLWLTFLRDFIRNDRRKLDADVILTKEHDWIAQTDDKLGHEAISSLHVAIPTALGIPTGIKTIQVYSMKDSASGPKETKVRDYNTADLPKAK